jgi:hypothetical protein
VPPGTPSLWFDGSDIDGDGTYNSAYADGDPVTTWVDKGALGVDATQATAGAKPTYRAGGGPGAEDAIEFDGGDILQSASFSSDLAQVNLVSGVAKWDSNTGAQYVWAGRSTGISARNDLFKSTATRTVVAGSVLSGTATGVAGQWDSLVATYDGVSSVLRVNGSVDVSGNAGAQGMGGITLGGHPSTPTFIGYLDGSLAEVLVYDTSPTASDVEDYFADKHAVTFPVAP